MVRERMSSTRDAENSELDSGGEDALGWSRRQEILRGRATSRRRDPPDRQTHVYGKLHLQHLQPAADQTLSTGSVWLAETTFH